ncbi:acetyl/propionyl/methylcrotonyl-CoA carboxylase subunit alpha [Ferrimonas marina]|uniref:Biotin carboxylase n=1 Tax=Ferrimonas marina TaxID=299255 RepID=A0A1M5VMY5_9GAMM|nr:acetyl/propionyl/methylcrotonyl-CoA carboxylase subunit alpha [Ferrimonas marina]SHH76587.1 3-methylcrotonyl-CoA carboxylase alpha subunit [Ferrimonas marina]
MTPNNINKLLIANRGEIACRIIDTCRSLGIRTLAVYSDADRQARHVALADEAFRIGPAPAVESYLKGDLLLQIAKAQGCDAIHPGYGFLSENPEFARACEKQGVIFVGPSAEAIDKMGSKSAAKAIMEEAGVPMLPGYHGDEQDDEHLMQQAQRIGFPLLIKATYGGGGKGMRVVESLEAMPESLASARREARAAFGNDQLLLERYLRNPRHVEVQVFADHHGHCLYLSDRDCSIQRRHQKVVEEAPAPGLSDELRRAMGEASVKAAQAIDYRGAGTVEYLLDANGEFFFMEMNTRLQVEHPVTELVTDVDLVAWQLAAAEGQPLPITQSQIPSLGHAIEVRLYAEDPQRDFLPATGTLEQLRWPDGVRIDTGVRLGDTITAYYDPMVAKIISFGADRTAACAQMSQALGQTRLSGPVTNLAFLRHIIDHPAFRQAKLDTGFIEQHQAQLLTASADRHWAAHAAALALLPDPAPMPQGWRLNAPARSRSLLEDEHGEHYDIALVGTCPGQWRTEQGQRLLLTHSQDQLQLQVDDRLMRWPCFAHEDGSITVQLSDGPGHFRPHRYQADQDQADAAKALQAPMNGTHIANLIKIGDIVASGQALVVMEAMKMEYTITAPHDGVVKGLPFQPGDAVADGQPLVQLEVSA